MQNELKPCPFCGSEPHFRYHDSEIYWTEWYIDCKACGYCLRNKAVGDKAALLEAKKAWNTRQPSYGNNINGYRNHYLFLGNKKNTNNF